jgi:Protein of unknown function (DUF3592)
MNHEISIQPGIFFGQIVYVCGGLFLMLLGAAIFYTTAHWRRHGVRVEGTIVGVRRQGLQIHNVYQYALPSGGVHEATATQGSGSLKGRETGLRVEIRVLPDHPEQAHEAPSLVMWALAFGLFLGGGWLTYDSVTEWKRSPVTWTMVALLAIFAGGKIWRWLPRQLKKMQSQMGTTDIWSGLPIESAETLGLSPQARRVQVQGKNPGQTGLVFCIAGLVIIAFSYFPTHQLRELRSGTRTEGKVLRLAESGGAHHHALYPQVQYTNTEGATVSFWDHQGANPSPYQVGDQVTVLYLPGKKGSAMIDHGKRNWDSVIALLLLGSTLLALGLFTLKNLLSPASQGGVSQPYQV